MNGFNLGELSATGLFIVVVLKIVFDFVQGYYNKKKPNGDCAATDRTLSQLAQSIEEKFEEIDRVHKKHTKWLENLYDMHNVRDADGVPLWYVRRSLEEVIGKLADNIDKQSQLMEKLVGKVNRLDEDVRQTTETH